MVTAAASKKRVQIYSTVRDVNCAVDWVNVHYLGTINFLMYTSDYKVHPLHYPLNTTHCTLHNVDYTLYTTHCTYTI